MLPKGDTSGPLALQPLLSAYFLLHIDLATCDWTVGMHMHTCYSDDNSL